MVLCHCDGKGRELMALLPKLAHATVTLPLHYHLWLRWPVFVVKWQVRENTRIHLRQSTQYLDVINLQSINFISARKSV